ncbi:hypothetical protein J437_LFUL002697 [Ladona fulva]|uniref:Uncharacterized protein n=1 Tax=Ladona fulva TaxID=123851 RepID=A0A8K0JVG5_LADFU|nr:hypothetical protein J437_LFUL002697 [Ladona fulva]
MPLYDENCLTFNCHLLNHLPQSVLNWGPLWAHSSFLYEDYNQQLLMSVRGLGSGTRFERTGSQAELLVACSLNLPAKASWTASREKEQMADPIRPFVDVSCPVLAEDILSSCVFLANSCHSGINTFATVNVLNGSLSKEEEHMLTDVI